MPEANADGVLIVHAGAMGDTAMIWPLLRALLRAPGADGAARGVRVDGTSVVRAAVSPAMVGATRSAMAGVGGASALVCESGDAQAFARLWVGDASAEGWEDRIGTVLSFVVREGRDGADAQWMRAARERFGAGPAEKPAERADVRVIGPPGSASRTALWDWARVDALGGVERAPNDDGPIVLHVGGGGASKRWAMERFAALADDLEREHPGRVRLLAGHVELETFDGRERRMFEDLGGLYVTDAEELLRDLARARLVVAGDTGPGHVAAQIGLRVVSLFGPTDPAVWSPRGAPGCVRVIAPAKPSAMAWLEVERVRRAVREMLGDERDV